MAQYVIEWKFTDSDPEDKLPPWEFHEVVIDRYLSKNPTNPYYEHWDQYENGESVAFEAESAAMAREILEEVRLRFLGNLDDVNRIVMTSSADDAAESALHADQAQRAYPEIVKFLAAVADPESVEWSASAGIANVHFDIGPWACILGWPRTDDPNNPYGVLLVPAPDGCEYPPTGESFTWNLRYMPTRDPDEVANDEPAKLDLNIDVSSFPHLPEGMDLARTNRDSRSIAAFLDDAHELLKRAGVLPPDKP
ncbi:hypothetical protein [Nocardia sp. NPDC004722]